jgi:mutator protein MutT
MAKRTAADPLVVAAAIIERNGRYLIAQRRRESMHGGEWEFPGGKREAGETLEECLRREVREELGVDVAVKELEQVIRHVSDYGWVELHFFRCALTKGEPDTLGCQALRWVLPAELTGYAFPPANRLLIEALSRV